MSTVLIFLPHHATVKQPKHYSKSEWTLFSSWDPILAWPPSLKGGYEVVPTTEDTDMSQQEEAQV